MADVERVCCMCGDVGFPDKIFRCIKCHHRYQHLYCSNYYIESSEPPELCDWCQSEVTRTTKAGGSSKKTSSKAAGARVSNRPTSSQKAKSGVPAPKTGTRKYKLLKDIMRQ